MIELQRELGAYGNHLRVGVSHWDRRDPPLKSAAELVTPQGGAQNALDTPGRA